MFSRGQTPPAPFPEEDLGPHQVSPPTLVPSCPEPPRTPRVQHSPSAQELRSLRGCRALPREEGHREGPALRGGGDSGDIAGTAVALPPLLTLGPAGPGSPLAPSRPLKPWGRERGGVGGSGGDPGGAQGSLVPSVSPAGEVALTLCPFMPGRPAVPGRPRAPWGGQGAVMEALGGRRAPQGPRGGRGQLGVSPRVSHLRAGGTPLSGAARFASFTLRTRTRPWWHVPNMPGGSCSPGGGLAAPPKVGGTPWIVTYVISVLARGAGGTSGTHGTLRERGGRGEAAEVTAVPCHPATHPGQCQPHCHGHVWAQQGLGAAVASPLSPCPGDSPGSSR